MAQMGAGCVIWHQGFALFAARPRSVKRRNVAMMQIVLKNLTLRTATISLLMLAPMAAIRLT